MSKSPDLNWRQVELEYVTGNDSVSHSFLSAKYGVSINTISAQSSRKKWVMKRNAHRDKIQEIARQKIETYQIESMEELNRQELRICDTVIGKGLEGLLTNDLKPKAADVLRASTQKRKIYETIFEEERQPDQVIEHKVRQMTPELENELFAKAAELFLDEDED